MREKARSYVENDIKGNLLARLFDRQLEKLERAVGIVRDASGNDALLRTLEREAGTLRSERKLRLTMLYTNTRYPTAEALRFLHADGLIEVQYGERRTMQDGSAFDEYRVLLLLPTKRKIWAAHFHFNSPDDFPEDFVSGHLKTWSQRRMSSRQAAEAGQRLHRGRLTLEQARESFPSMDPVAEQGHRPLRLCFLHRRSRAMGLSGDIGLEQVSAKLGALAYDVNGNAAQFQG